MGIAIKAENISKAYQLGEIGTGTLSRDLERWYNKLCGKEDPFLKIGEPNDRTKKGNSDIVWSLKNINFEIEQGDAVGIIGRNGAGKSTLLKVLSRVTSPTEGIIKGNGRIASLLEVGTGFHPELTGRENIYLNGTILGMRKIEITRKFEEIVNFAGVERYIDTPVKRYSSGMYVRLAFAVAAHLDSEILIVDEVLAVGDAEFQKKCLGKMGEVSHKQGRTVLFVSHNMLAVTNLCNKGMLIDQGSLKNYGRTKDIIDIYLENDKKNGFEKKIDKILATGIADISILNIDKREIYEITKEDYVYIAFKIAEDEIKSNIVIGFTLLNENDIPIYSSISSDKALKFEKEGLILSKIPVANLNPGKYFLEYTFNGKNLENALSIEKTWSMSNYIMSGQKSRASQVFCDWEILK